MNQKKLFKLLSAIMIIFTMLTIVSNLSMATSVTAEIKPDESAASPFTGAMETIIGIAQVLCAGVGAIMIIALGLKYMSAAPGDKAEIKKHAVVYIVGAVIAFGAAGVIAIFKTFVTETLAK